MEVRVTYHRRQPRPLDVIESLLHQGVKITCYRTREPVTLANFHDLEREHLVEIGLKTTDAEKAAIDTPEYWRWSFSEAHAKITDGNRATSAGSSKHRIAKAKRMEKERLAPQDERYAFFVSPNGRGGEYKRIDSKPKRKMESPGFDKSKTKKFGTGKVVPRKSKGATREL